MLRTYYPSTLGIFLTSDCNLRCRYCFVSKRDIIYHNPTPVYYKFKQGVDIFLALPGKTKEICFTGGEPLLEFKKIQEVIRYLQTRNNSGTVIKTSIISNGTLLNQNYLNFLEKNNVTLTISLDGNRRFHDYNRRFIRKKSSSHKQIINNLKNIRDNKRYKIHASLIFTPDTYKNLLKNILFLQKVGFGYIDFYPDIYSSWSNEDIKNLKNEIGRFADFYLHFLKKYKKKPFLNSLLYNFSHEEKLYTPLICRNAYLDGNGNFYYCDKVFSLPEFQRKKFRIGDTAKGIDNLLRLKLLDEKRKEIKIITGIDCQRCKYIKYCFCLIGHYISLCSRRRDIKKSLNNLCCISQIYINNFLKIKSHFSNPINN